MGLKKLLVGTVAVSALLAGATAANAGPERHGWYVNMEAGWVHLNDTGLPGVAGFQSIEYSSGWGALLGFGHSFDNHLRLEFEAGYRNNDADQTNNIPAIDGEFTEYSAMVNMIYDAPIASRWLLNIGAGIGLDVGRYDDRLGREDTDTQGAVQGILGLTHRLSDHWDLAVTYRYLWAEDMEYTIGGVRSDFEVAKHNVMLGFRYGYDDPPPPPAPAAPEPPPAPQAQPKQFIVFFGFNKCNITAEADAVLSEAASAAKSSGSASVRIVGHTDTVGSPAYNQKLSECRANAAKANLVGKGVADGAISTSGKGESELMVQTGDSVKEPQNRRATVDLQ
ncbi:MAG: outer membrane beta-barrel protein [Alphaproteobacteria bacterium]|nr:outer membrane beta-barrel protein [Alphaproteobacteria bacterium]